MSAELVMAGPGQPVTHNAPHDLESLFYVLVGICVLLDEPFKFKSDEGLSRCFDKYFNTFEPSVLKSITIQSELTWFPMIVDHISPYFKPLLPLLTRLRQEIVLPMYTDKDGNFCRAKSLTHHILIDAIMDTLLNLNDDAWTPRNTPDTGNKVFTGRSGGSAVGESKHGDDQGEIEGEGGSRGGDERKDKNKDEDEIEIEQEVLSPAGETSASPPPTQSITSDSESDQVESYSTPVLYRDAFLRPNFGPPDLPRFASRASGGMGFQSDIFVSEVRRRALEDVPDDYSLPRVKRARSSSKPSDEAGNFSSRFPPRSMLKGRSTNTTTTLRRSTRTTGKKTE